ncbi:iron complex transport system substrate-binding protein [Arthrobacter ginsengisoli]|uniref:Iron complex transport system substrate-binding protein n=1 Tax=Arthrobacter ginsengisoli TaxID=1356565 RepID=A0ABU1U8U0_9MICC|nr:siderophore ABC transporter substrate-binding protein [Arthrobacter ginsengisoli]MDR7081601.1 iron complex transport system substrate-binding protein [Arthrobacter ginsengisoli]
MKNRLKPGLGALTAALLFALTGCGQAATVGTAAAEKPATITVEHAQGTTADVPVNPETVFTFDLGVLDTMDALGVEPDGVPKATYPAALQKYSEERFTKIGSMKEPDFEAISAGAPDLIIISGRTAGAYEELSKIAPTIDLTLDTAEPMASFKSQTATLGKIFGKEALVTDKLAAIDSTIGETRAKAADAGRGLIVLTSGGELTAYGAGSRFGIIHDVLGVTAAADIKADAAHGEAVSFEFIKETNPDVLYVVNRDSATGSDATASNAVLDNDLVQSTNAGKNGKIVGLDPAGWYLVGYGLNNIQAMVEAVAGSVA